MQSRKVVFFISFNFYVMGMCFALIGAVANVNRLMLSITESGDIHGKQGQNIYHNGSGIAEVVDFETQNLNNR